MFRKFEKFRKKATDLDNRIPSEKFSVNLAQKKNFCRPITPNIEKTSATSF